MSATIAASCSKQSFVNSGRVHISRRGEVCRTFTSVRRNVRARPVRLAVSAEQVRSIQTRKPSHNS
eukprot:9499465-Pyramimonas_sp.AAC.2